ncbi:MAG TPA: hypothetical protein VMH40_09310 [Myxococcaceae bacterium]|nr:hypothetical protein [Myxococcaceae bacterium]
MSSPLPPSIPVTEVQLQEAERRRDAGESMTAIAASLKMSRPHLANCLVGKRGPRAEAKRAHQAGGVKRAEALAPRATAWTEPRPYSAHQRREHNDAVRAEHRALGESLGRERARVLLLIDEAGSLPAHERARQLFDRIEDKLDREHPDVRRVAEWTCKALREGCIAPPTPKAPALTDQQLDSMSFEELVLARQNATDGVTWGRLSHALQQRVESPWDFKHEPEARLRALLERLHELWRDFAKQHPAQPEARRAAQAYSRFVERLGPEIHRLQGQLGHPLQPFLVPAGAPAPRKARGEERLRHESATDRLLVDRPELAALLRR